MISQRQLFLDLRSGIVNVLLGTRTGMREMITFVALRLAGLRPVTADPDPSPGLKAKKMLDLQRLQASLEFSHHDRAVSMTRNHGGQSLTWDRVITMH